MNAVQLVERLRVERPHEQWANFAADHLKSVLKALEKAERDLALNGQHRIKAETEHIITQALATVAEAAQKALGERA